MTDPEIRITGQQVRVRQGRRTLLEAPLPQFVRAIADTGERGLSCGVVPNGVRMWIERRDATAVAVEIAPHTRTVRWLADGSKSPYGPGARYDEYRVAFPFVVLLLVLRGGALTGLQQLYYRTAPLEMGEELLLSNLYNVAEGHGQRSWVCLQNLEDLSEMPWPRKIAAIVDHVFTAAFNRSSERHEGNSYWGSREAVDARLASMEAWQEATRQNPLFVLDVPWAPAGETASQLLRAMFDRVVTARQPETVEELTGLISSRRGLAAR